MQRVTRPSTMTIRGVAVPVAEYQVWRDDESDYEMEDESMVENNLDQAWAAYWRTFPLSELLTMRETAVRDIEGIDRAMLGARYEEEIAAVDFEIDREVLARFERGQCLACEPQREWFWYEDGNVVGVLTSQEFEAIKRLTDRGLLKHETR